MTTLDLLLQRTLPPAPGIAVVNRPLSTALWTRVVWASAAAVLLTCTAAADPAAANANAPADVAKIEQRGLDLYFGRGAPANAAAAAREFEIAAQAGRPYAQYLLAEQLRLGEGVAVNPGRALQLYKSAAGQGLAIAQSVLGWMYLNGTGAPQDYTQAVQWLSAAARQDHGRALLMLSDVYRRGTGVTADPDFAHRLLVRAAELGDVDACVELGALLLAVPVAQRNTEYALQMLRKAAGLEDRDAAYILGWWYLSNERQSRELATAARWMSQAANAQHPMAMLWLSEMYEKGLGLTVDIAKARQLRDQGLASASLADKNEFAWSLSVHGDALLRNGGRAVEVMDAALAAPAPRTAAYLDTLAAAHAETGNFEAAIAAQQEALRVLVKSPQTRAMGAGMAQRLQSYRDGQAFHEPSR